MVVLTVEQMGHNNNVSVEYYGINELVQYLLKKTWCSARCKYKLLGNTI